MCWVVGETEQKWLAQCFCWENTSGMMNVDSLQNLHSRQFFLFGYPLQMKVFNHKYFYLLLVDSSTRIGPSGYPPGEAAAFTFLLLSFSLRFFNPPNLPLTHPLCHRVSSNSNGPANETVSSHMTNKREFLLL